MDGITVREVELQSKKGGEPVTIIQLTDLHFNQCCTEDLQNPTLCSTHQNRRWLAEGASMSNAERLLAYADSQKPDQIVITGDAIDYLSEGCLQLLKSMVWDRYRGADGRVTGILVGLGNHDLVQKMQGEVEETLPLEQREAMLEQQWEHDPYYTSRVLKNKVMVIQLDNSSIGGFRQQQAALLQADLAAARRAEYTVLLFYHIPISTGNPHDQQVKSLYVGDAASSSVDFYGNAGMIGPQSSGVNGAIYQMITENADVIAGCFCGHLHADFYTEIQATTATGEKKTIPQYVLVGAPYDRGHALKITVK